MYSLRPVTDIVRILQEHVVMYGDVTMLSSVQDVNICDASSQSKSSQALHSVSMLRVVRPLLISVTVVLQLQHNYIFR